MTLRAKGYVGDELYEQVTATFPVVCIDVIPYARDTGKIGVITRGTGKEAGLMALVGGRIRKNETIDDAIRRHLSNDLGIEKFKFFGNNAPETPFYVQQYKHADKIDSTFGAFDPTKHSIGLMYVIEIEGIPAPRAEAADFHWLDKRAIPALTAYNQRIAMLKAFEFIQKHP